eukprot:8729864-Ditylum_brightwellii.AAC.1
MRRTPNTHGAARYKMLHPHQAPQMSIMGIPYRGCMVCGAGAEALPVLHSGNETIHRTTHNRHSQVPTSQRETAKGNTGRTY